MPDWLLRFFTWLTKRAGDDLRDNFKALTEAYDDLMKQHQNLNQALQQRIDALEHKVDSLASALELERTAHAECRRTLKEHESAIRDLKAQVQVIQRTQDDAGS